MLLALRLMLPLLLLLLLLLPLPHLPPPPALPLPCPYNVQLLQRAFAGCAGVGHGQQLGRKRRERGGGLLDAATWALSGCGRRVTGTLLASPPLV